MISEEGDSDDEEGMGESSEGSLSDCSNENNEDLRRSVLEQLVPALDPSEYGKMPSYYSNSQRVASSSATDQGTGCLQSGKQNIKIRDPLFPRDRFDGVDSDDETESDEDRLDQVGTRDGENSDCEEDRPQLIGDVEIDMAEEEEEFIKFSRDALGIDEETWASIVKDRKARGGMVRLFHHII
jgi:hypothetical protein